MDGVLSSVGNPASATHRTDTMNYYRILQDGHEIWRGKAYDTQDAEERCFDAWDETPGSLERFTLQRWGAVKLTSSIKGKAWITIYANQCLAPV